MDRYMNYQSACIDFYFAELVKKLQSDFDYFII